jgi:hypothetical protein
LKSGFDKGMAGGRKILQIVNMRVCSDIWTVRDCNVVWSSRGKEQILFPPLAISLPM